MGFFGDLLKGALSSLTGGLFGGGGQQAPQQMIGVQQPPNVDLEASATPFWQSYLAPMRGAQAKQPQGYSAQAALAGPTGIAAGMSQLQNRYGGMANTPGVGLFANPQGPGRGGAGGAATDTSYGYEELMKRLQQGQTSLAGAYAPQFGKAFGQALAGQYQLPQEQYQRQLTQGMSTINAQSGNARQGLMENLGSRGLMQSGLMGAGLRGVESARLGGVGQLVSGLNQQSLQATQQAQQQAMAIYPELARIDVAQQGNQMQGMVALQQLEYQAQQLGINRDQLHNLIRSGNMSALTGLFGALFNRPKSPNVLSGGGTQINYSQSGLYG